MWKPLLTLFTVSLVGAQNEISDFENPTDCGNQATDWKPCVERKIADQVFGSCCERFVPPECRGLCVYESNPIEARVVVKRLFCPP
ncbi:hypothetical protein L596_003339 [Steinernema carpocapsae]|uniref:TIL domain-containing protein n=1 Tax=Steinernema carpocapsae TaxID=34508 RepID=A0A4V6I802_STECR|nr:hypothetical protein L596_003339 [Steinernema carpocapsae]